MTTDGPSAPVILSVVVPCRNAARSLGELLEALTLQRWGEPWEIVVADNGSTDDTAETVGAYVDRLPGLRRIDASGRRGAAHARNAGARAARGEFLVFCDADDVPAEGWIAAMAGALRRHELAASRFETERLNSRRVARARSNPQNDGVQRLWYPPYLPHAGGSGLGVRRALHEEIRGFDESLRMLEDTDYCIRAQTAGGTLGFAPDAVLHVRYRDGCGGAMRQARRWARYNELIYRRYGRGEPPGRRPWREYLRKWKRLARETRKLLDPEARLAWCWRFGWLLGLLQGSVLHRVPPV